MNRMYGITFTIYHCKCDPIYTIHSNIILAHVFYLLNDLAEWFLM